MTRATDSTETKNDRKSSRPGPNPLVCTHVDRPCTKERGIMLRCKACHRCTPAPAGLERTGEGQMWPCSACRVDSDIVSSIDNAWSVEIFKCGSCKGVVRAEIISRPPPTCKCLRCAGPSDVARVETEWHPTDCTDLLRAPSRPRSRRPPKAVDPAGIAKRLDFGNC